MGEYELHHIIDELMYEKANMPSTSRGHTTGARTEIYTESWMALNSWIESKLSRRKGVEVPMLGQFTWEFKTLEGQNDLHCRPIFILSESFIKEHHVRRQRTHKLPLIAPCEEINYSRLAIKYSKSLTKDMVFAGVRDILKKIGTYVDRVYEFRIDFTFGSLHSKERQIKFEFNQSRINEILPENTSGLYFPSLAEQQRAAALASVTISNRQSNAPSSSSSSSSATSSNNYLADTRLNTGGMVGGGSSQSHIPYSYTGGESDWDADRSYADSPGPATSARSEYSLPFMTARQPVGTSVGGGAGGNFLDNKGKVKVPTLALRASTAAQLPSEVQPSSNPAVPSENRREEAKSNQFDYYTSANQVAAEVGAAAAAAAMQNAMSDSSSSSTNEKESSLTRLAKLRSDPRRKLLSPRTQELIISLQERDDVPTSTLIEQRNKAREKVTQQAFLRCVDDLSGQAKTSSDTILIKAMQNEQEALLETNKRNAVRDRMKLLKKELEVQLSQGEEKRKKEKEDQRNAICAFFLNTESEDLINPVGSVRMSGGREAVRKELKSDLMKQMKYNAGT